MTHKKPSNVAASVRQRLLNIIRETGDEANLLWTRYATERLLYRLSVSKYCEDFVLKGAMLFIVWKGQLYRPTGDIDFLGRGENSSERLKRVFREICAVRVEPDGLEFDPASVQVEPIREEQEYQGQRITMTSFLGKARIPIQVDVGFGDVVIPQAKKICFPTLLDFPAPHIRACPRETVVAEKLQAIVMLGIANSRMKDFYDLYTIAKDFDFDGSTLIKAIKATFKRRKTEIPNKIPLALTEEFGLDEMKSVQWKAFVRKIGLEQCMPELLDVLKHLQEFLLLPMEAASGTVSIPKYWNAGGPWIPAET